MSRQALKILSILDAAKGEWVPLPELARDAHCFAVATRISLDLRKRGIEIENKVEQVGRQKYSFYRLVKEQP